MLYSAISLTAVHTVSVFVYFVCYTITILHILYIIIIFFILIVISIILSNSYVKNTKNEKKKKSFIVCVKTVLSFFEIFDKRSAWLCRWGPLLQSHGHMCN